LSHGAIHNVYFVHAMPRRWAAAHHIHRHHPDKNFGVTTPLWDIVLGTRYISRCSEPARRTDGSQQLSQVAASVAALRRIALGPVSLQATCSPRIPAARRTATRKVCWQPGAPTTGRGLARGRYYSPPKPGALSRTGPQSQ
jgi:hypothetical protein